MIGENNSWVKPGSSWLRPTNQHDTCVIR